MFFYARKYSGFIFYLGLLPTLSMLCQPPSHNQDTYKLLNLLRQNSFRELLSNFILHVLLRETRILHTRKRTKYLSPCKIDFCLQQEIFFKFSPWRLFMLNFRGLAFTQFIQEPHYSKENFPIDQKDFLFDGFATKMDRENMSNKQQLILTCFNQNRIS